MPSFVKRILIYWNCRPYVADHFARDPVVISVGVKRLEERPGMDRGFSHRVEILEKNLIRNKKVIKVN
jgi:hypothetical protein